MGRDFQKKDFQNKPRKKPDFGRPLHAVPAVIEELIGRTGGRGEITQVRCKIQEGPDSGKILRRNVKGTVRKNDILMLRETEIEARRLAQGRKNG